MKKKSALRKTVLALFAMFALTLSGCEISISPADGDKSNRPSSNTSSDTSGSGQSSEDKQDQIMAVYQLYVADKMAAGETPLSYDEWLETVRGPQGEPGQAGAPGQNGKDGNTILYGSVDPSSNDGNVGDSFINISTWDFFVKDATGWTKKGSLKGAQGDPGQPGQQGKDGTSMLTGHGAPSANGKVGDSYIDLDTWDFYTYGDNGWAKQGNIKGAQGDPGTPGSAGQNGQNGENGVTPHIGDNGNWFIGDVDTGKPARGADGQNGENGQNGITPQIGNNGNWFIGDDDTGIPATGPAGQNGTNGQDGAAGQNGKDGTSVITGHGVPGDIGKNGDSYINLDNWDFYVKDNDEWSLEGNIKGGQGAAGENGHDGGQGQQGEQGPAGQNGTSFRTGSGAPSAELGIEGDSYLDYSTYDLYVKSSGHWVKVGNISGSGSSSTVYHVSFDKNGASGSMDDILVDSDSFILPECRFTAPLGEQFSNWQIGDDYYNVGDEVDISSDLTVVANWSEIGYNLSVSVPEAHPYPGETYPLTISIAPNVSLDQITVGSSDADVLTISQDKTTIQTHSVGSATITATYRIGDYTYDASLDVIVEARPVVYDPVDLDFYAFNDMHGNVLDSNTGLGLEKTSTLIKNLSDKRNALLVSQGDMWQGSCESNSTRGALVTRWMNQLGFTSMTLGNHEFDWGSDFISANAATANFPILGINVLKRADGERADYAEPSVIVEKEGVKVGIIGAIGNCYSSITSSKVQDVRFAQGNELSTLVKNESTRLRNEEDCDFIVYSVHDGDDCKDNIPAIYDDYDLTLSSGHYVDIVFEGHSHKDYRLKDEAGVWHIQGAAYNQTFNHVAVEIDPNTGRFDISAPEAVVTNNYVNTVSADEDTTDLMGEYNFSQYYETIGVNSVERNASELKQKVADLYLEKGIDKWNGKYDIVLGGGYISCRSPYKLPVGNVTYAQLYNLFPFDNDVVLCTIPGEYLLSQFINTTDVNYFIAYTSYGTSIKDSIDPEGTYYIVTDTYSLDFAPNHLTLVDTFADYGYYARDCMRDHIEAGYYYIPGLTGQGTPDNPYTVDDAYTIIDGSAYTSNNALWGWYKGKVSSLSNMTNGAGFMQNVVLSDEGGAHSINAYRIWKYDGATSNESFLSLDDEVLFYGSAYVYNDAPSFGGVNVTVLANDHPIIGLDETDVASATQFNLIRQAGYTGALYVDGYLYSFSRIEETSRYNLYISKRSISIQNYQYDAVQFRIELTQEQLNVIEIGVRMIFVNNEEADTSTLVDIDNHGTFKNPLSVSEAIALAQSNGNNSSNVTSVYCRGTVSRLGDSVGSSGDIRNVYISDGEGHEIQIYYLKKCETATANNGLNFTSVNDLPVGTEVLIYGKPFNYNNTTPEFASGTYCVLIDNQPIIHPSEHQGIDNALNVPDFFDFIGSFGNHTISVDLSDTYLKGRLASITDNGDGTYACGIASLNSNKLATIQQVVLDDSIDSVNLGDIITVGFNADASIATIVRAQVGHDNYSPYILVYFNSGLEVYFDIADAGTDGNGNRQYTGTFYMSEGTSFVFIYNGKVETPTIEVYSFGGNPDNPNVYQQYIVLEDGRYVVQQDFVDQAFTFYLKVDGSGKVIAVYISFAS